MVLEPRTHYATDQATLSLFSDTDKETPDKVAPRPARSARSSRPAPTKDARTGTFIDNLRLPVHRWFRYSAGFSAKWVESVLKERASRSLFDPFAGSGTSMLAADAVGIPSQGTEAHPFVQRIAKAKLLWDFDPRDLDSGARELVAISKAAPHPDPREKGSLTSRIYTAASLEKLDRMRLAHLELVARGAPTTITELLWLAITSILRPCSFAGTAQWQYVLPGKTKSAEREPYEAFDTAVQQMMEDRHLVQLEGWRSNSAAVSHDARLPFSFIGGSAIDTVITSPPYPNNYDYADATRVEMTFWKDISGWADLQNTVRRHLMRSCSQHTAAERLQLAGLLADPVVAPIREELTKVCEHLADIRLNRGGEKTYHTMVAACFNDLGRVFRNLRMIAAPGATICFVIGDSDPYGVHVPAERWLGQLAVASGFGGWRFEKLRDRNIKWDNRVHDVPLHEGNLWIEG